MADLSITAASFGYSGSTPASLEYVQFGETVTQGQPVYYDSATGTYKKADANASSTTAQAVALAASPSASGYGLIAKRGSKVILGATVASGTEYYVSNTAGGICPKADLTTGASYVNRVGYAVSTTEVVLTFDYLGVTAP